MEQERKTLKVTREVGNLVTPHSQDLPFLPPWAAPIRWDYWGRPYAYMDEPSGHPKVGVENFHRPPSQRVMVAVLVNCPLEPQYLPNMDVAHTASDVAVWAGHQARVLLLTGELTSNLPVETAAICLIPRNYSASYSASAFD